MVFRHRLIGYTCVVCGERFDRWQRCKQHEAATGHLVSQSQYSIRTKAVLLVSNSQPPLAFAGLNTRADLDELRPILMLSVALRR